DQPHEEAMDRLRVVVEQRLKRRQRHCPYNATAPWNVRSGSMQPPLCGVAQRGEVAALGQPLERVFLDLPDSLSRDAELATGLAQRRGLSPAESEPELNHVALALGQAVDRLLHRARAGTRDHLVLGI